MKKLLIVAALAAIATGCATKSRMIDIKGMFVSESGQLAIGYAHVDAIPEGTESAVVHYKEDVALLRPSVKTHDIDITLTGTNAVGSAESVVSSICQAFVSVAPSIAKTNAEIATSSTTSPIDLAKANSDNKKAVELTKNAVKEIKAVSDTAPATTDGVAAQTETVAAACPDGTCPAGACTDGTCKP